MEHHPPLYRPRQNLFAGTLVLSLALHIAFALTTFLLPGRLTRLAPEQIVMVDLNDANLPLPQENRKAIAQPPAPAIRQQMELPSPDAKILPAPPETPVEETVPQAPPQPEAASLSLGLTRGFFRSISDGETLNGDVREYYFKLVERVNEQWWAAAGGTNVEPGQQEALVTIIVKKNGEIFSARLVRSSGSNEYDRMIMNTLQNTSNLPPLPAGYKGEFFQAPLRLLAPRGLLFS